MATLKDTWNTSAPAKKIQNPNYIMDGLNALHDFGAVNGITINYDNVLNTNYHDIRYMCGSAYNGGRLVTETSGGINTFAGIGYNGTNYSKQTVIDTFPRYYPEMATASSWQTTYLSSSYTANSYVCRPTPGVDMSTNSIVWHTNSVTAFKNFRFDEDDLVLNYNSFYTDNDGSAQTLLWRELYSYTTHCPTCVIEVFHNGVYVPMWINTLGFVACQKTGGILDSTSEARWLALLSEPPLKWLAIVPNKDSPIKVFRGFVIYGKKADWEKFFDSLGMKWSWNLDDVISPDDDDLRKPITPGLPSNPVIDDDGPGSNITDPVKYPDLQYVPTSTVYDRYFITPNQIPDLKTFLFSETFINNIKRLWTNPAEYVISLSCYPFDVRNSGLVTTNTDVTIGGVTSDIPALALTDIGAPYFYGGSVKVDNYYNSYLDYEPYTTIDIYLPYIGVRPLNVSQIVGHTLNVGYYIDFGTQQITALLGLDGDINSLGQVLGEYNGTIGIQTPLGGTSAQQLMQNIITQTTGFISGVGALAGGIATANPALIAGGISGMGGSVLGGGHTSPSYYGTLSPISALFSPQCAYLIINRPRQAIPAAYLSQHGFSSSFSGKVSEFSGYLECTSVNMSSGNTMTEQEQNEITRLLTGGIYI